MTASSTSPTEPDSARPSVTVRYWAAAKSAAGVAEESFSGTTAGEVLAAARAAHSKTPRFGQVLDVCSYLVGEQPVGLKDPSTVQVTDGDVLEVLPPFAGG
ncbi:MAG: MoaD/ThiS family protein [Nocardioidaceae bacterium]